MPKSDDRKLEALARKNAMKAANAAHRPQRSDKRRQYDDTLQPEPEDKPDRAFFKDMQRREF